MLPDWDQQQFTNMETDLDMAMKHLLVDGGGSRCVLRVKSSDERGDWGVGYGRDSNNLSKQQWNIWAPAFVPGRRLHKLDQLDPNTENFVTHNMSHGLVSKMDMDDNVEVREIYPSECVSSAWSNAIMLSDEYISDIVKVESRVGSVKSVCAHKFDGKPPSPSGHDDDDFIVKWQAGDYNLCNCDNDSCKDGSNLNIKVCTDNYKCNMSEDQCGSCMSKRNLHSHNGVNVNDKNHNSVEKVFFLLTDYPKCVYVKKKTDRAVGFKQDVSWNMGATPMRNYTPLPKDISCVDLAMAIRESGVCNATGYKFPISSDMNIEAWRKHLDAHQEPRLVEFLEYGFHLGMEGSEALQRSNVENHSSAIEYPVAIQRFLKKEVQLGAMLGPFKEPPCDHYHVSPLMSHLKDGNDRRIIIDLSYGDLDSVNGVTPRGVYDGGKFNLTLPSLDYLIADIMECEERPKLVKVDIARAFRNVRN